MGAITTSVFARTSGSEYVSNTAGVAGASAVEINISAFTSGSTSEGDTETSIFTAGVGSEDGPSYLDEARRPAAVAVAAAATVGTTAAALAVWDGVDATAVSMVWRARFLVGEVPITADPLLALCKLVMPSSYFGMSRAELHLLAAFHAI